MAVEDQKTIEYARNICKELELIGGYSSTNYILAALNIPKTSRSNILQILHGLVKVKVLEVLNTGGKALNWKLVDKDWNRTNPLKGKLERKQYEKEDKMSDGDLYSKFRNPSCARCFKPIEKGAPITKWTNPSGKTTWVHKNCNHTDKPAEVTETDTSKISVDSSALATLLVKLDSLEKEVALLSKTRKVQIEIKKQDKVATIDEHTHPIFEQVMFHISCGDHVMLVGPKGCGKTHLAEQVAKGLERDFGMLSLSGGVTEGKLFGRVAPNINTGENVYTATRFVELYETGGVYLLDEVDAADPNVLLSVNGALANGKMPIERPSKPVAKKHRNFVCMAAANTWGNGADRQYVGRNQQDSAFTERFVQIAMDYDEGLEYKLCPGGDELVATLHKYRRGIVANRLERSLSTRFILRAFNWVQHGKTLAYVDEMLFGGWRADEVTKVKNFA
jgi:cobaltochelatase CobS